MDSFGSEFYMSLETFFMKFYHQIVKAENVPDLDNTHDTSLRKVKKAYCRSSFEARDSNISFDLPEMRGAYVFQYATLFTSAVAFHFVEMLKQNQFLLKRLLDQETLVICCLGGGPATELLAIVKAIECMDYFHPGFRRLTEIQVVVVDIDCGWSVTANHVVRHLNRLSHLQCRLTFIKCDLAEPLTDELQAALRSAHILTAVKFLSVIYSMKGNNKTRLMLQRIIDCTSRGTLIFFLDSAVLKYWTRFTDSMKSSKCMVPIYDFFVGTYSLSRPTVTGRLKLFYKSYKKQRFCSQTKQSVSFWYKEEHRQVPRQTPAVSSNQWETIWETYPGTEPFFNYQVSEHHRAENDIKTRQLLNRCPSETNRARIRFVHYGIERNEDFPGREVHTFNAYGGSVKQFPRIYY